MKRNLKLMRFVAEKRSEVKAFCQKLHVTATALRSAGHLENVQPGTAADRSYRSREYIPLLICVRSAGYVADSSTKMRIYSSPPADAKLNVGCCFSFSDIIVTLFSHCQTSMYLVAH